MRIRDARPEDAPTLVEFNRRLAIDSDDVIPDREVLRRGVERALSHPELCRYFLAEDESEVVGQAMVTFELTDWRDGLLWWLQSVYVPPEHRRRGVFRALHGHILALARADPDARGLRLYALTSNRRALAAYEACGLKRGRYEVLEQDLDGEE